MSRRKNPGRAAAKRTSTRGTGGGVKQFEMAFEHHRHDRLEKAEKLYRLALGKNPQHRDAKHMLGVVCLQTERPEEALPYLQGVVAQYPDFAEALSNCANALNRLGRFAEAKAYCERALFRRPAYSDALNNLGNAQKGLGELEAAVDNFRAAIAEAPAMPDPWMFENLFNTFMFLHRLDDASRTALTALQTQVTDPAVTFNLLVGLGIVSWMVGKPEETQVAIAQAESMVDVLTTIPKSTKNARVFCSLLRSLLEQRDGNVDLYRGKPKSSIVFVAESHCLPAAGVRAEADGEIVDFVPAIILGCKAWHLAKPGGNEYKSSVQALFANLPTGTRVVLGMGEIDCRASEGIMPAYLDKGIDYRRSVPEFVGRYVDFVVSLAAAGGHSLMFYGVPAPSKEALTRLEPAHSALLREIVQIFNQALGSACEKSGVGLLDVYAATVDKLDGAGNMRHHLDLYHVRPNLYPVLYSLLAGNTEQA